MIDINNPVLMRDAGQSHGIDRTVMALWYFAHRDATAEGDLLLATKNLNRTHFRALFFINLSPGITLNELGPILQLSHQGASRVLADLIREDYVEQSTGAADRRQRHLRLTNKGKKLESQVVAVQTEMLARSARRCGEPVATAFRQFLVGLLSEEDYAKLVGMLAPQLELAQKSPRKKLSVSRA